jgi:hypothetical protein
MITFDKEERNMENIEPYLKLPAHRKRENKNNKRS